MKKIFLLLLCVLLLSGCGKKAVSADNFKEVLTNKGYDVVDVTKKEAYKETYIASNKNDYELKLLILENDSEAKRIQAGFRSKFIRISNNGEKVINDVDKINSNYSEFSIVVDDMYYYIVQIDNVCLKVEAPVRYKKEINKVVRGLIS